MSKKNSHCSYCGHPFAEGQPWPRTCASCGSTSFVNPLPVAVVLLPVDGGLLLVRRGIEPHRGELALPGGFIGLGESWQQAGARELFEETGVRIGPEEIADFRVLSAPDGTVLIFGLAPGRASAELPAFVQNEEASECVVIHWAQDLAFPLHTQVVEEYFARGPTGRG
jgi:ADP-ribose pyrophosphatase YjhB (NUDIX family)